MQSLMALLVTMQARTYQDLLKNEHDEALFEHYTTAELVSVKVCLMRHN